MALDLDDPPPPALLTHHCPPARPGQDRLLEALAQPRHALVLLACWYALLVFHGLFAGDLYRNESLRALVAQGMLDSGDWVVPRLYGEPLLTKPPGMYAAIAAASLPWGGVTPWSARLPSALAAAATGALFHWIFRRQAGPRAALLAALILPACPLWLDRAPSAEIDMLQVFWVSAALLFFLRAVEAEEEAVPDGTNTARTWWFLALLAVAGGFLTKWTAPAFFYATALPLLAWRKRLRLLFRSNHLLAVGLASAACLAWLGLAARETGWPLLVGTARLEALSRFLPGEFAPATAPHHPRPYPWMESLAFPFLFLAAALPWSAFALVGLRSRVRATEKPGELRLRQLLHCWVWPNLIFWTLVPGHAARNCLPVVPGLAGLAALAWERWLSGRAACPLSRVHVTRVLVVLLLAWVAVKLAFVHVVVPARSQGRDPLAKGRQIARFVPPDKTLYLFRFKDEGILFHYARAALPPHPSRPVRRLAGPGALPSTDEQVYCILSAAEWRSWKDSRPVHELLQLRDQQGDPIVLVRLGADHAGDAEPSP